MEKKYKNFLLAKYNEEVVPFFIQKNKKLNVMAVPRLQKIVINRGIGEATTDAKLVDLTYNQILKVSGQKPLITKSKKSISNFKVRKDQPIGCKVTLRSLKMYDFLVKLLNISLPKIRDFRGVPSNSFDGRGNYTLGLKEDSIFPEIKLESSDKVRGFDITFVTTAKTDKEAYDLLSKLGMPFRQN